MVYEARNDDRNGLLEMYKLSMGLEHLGMLGVLGETAPFSVPSVVLISTLCF